MTRIALVSIVALFAFAPTARAQAASKEPLLALADELYASRRYDVALGAYRAVAAARPAMHAAVVGQGRCLIALGRNDDAIDALAPLADRDPPVASALVATAQAHYWNGLARRQANDASGADASLLDAAIAAERAVEVAPDDAEARYTFAQIKLAGVAVDAKTAAAVLAALEPALKQKPNDPAYLKIHGDACAAAGRHAEAAAAYDRVVEVTPEQYVAFADSARRAAAIEYGLAGQTDVAVARLRAVVGAHPDDPVGYDAIWRALGDDPTRRAAAVDLLEALAKAHPTSPLPTYYLGYIHDKAKDRAAALAAFERCVATDAGGKRFDDAWMLVGEYRFFDNDDEAGAETAARRALEINPANTRAMSVLRNIVLRSIGRNDPVRAEAVTRMMIDAQPEVGGEWANLAKFLTEQRRYKEAWWAYEKALAYAGDNPDIVNAAGMLLHYYTVTVVDPEARARELYERTLELDPTHIHAMENLGMMLGKSGQDLERARALLSAVVEREPGRAVAMRELSRVLRKLRAAERDEAEADGNR